MAGQSEKILDERTRAEDILLGALGFDCDAVIVSLEETEGGFQGVGRWSDGETFPFESDDELSELEVWAVSVLLRGES